jgi:hypothetical protein
MEGRAGSVSVECAGGEAWASVSAGINIRGASGVHVGIWLGCNSLGHGNCGIVIWWGRDTNMYCYPFFDPYFDKFSNKK